MRPEASGRGAPRREKGEKNVVMGRAKEADPEKDPIDQQDSNTAAPGQGIGRTNNRLRISAHTAHAARGDRSSEIGVRSRSRAEARYRKSRNLTKEKGKDEEAYLSVWS
jgi:hypothetical protein